MKKSILTTLIFLVSISAFSQSKKDTIKALKSIDTTFSLNANKAIGLFNLLTISKEALAHTVSKNITVEQANATVEGINYYQKTIEEWGTKLQKILISTKK